MLSNTISSQLKATEIFYSWRLFNIYSATIGLQRPHALGQKNPTLRSSFEKWLSLVPINFSLSFNSIRIGQEEDSIYHINVRMRPTAYEVLCIVCNILL